MGSATGKENEKGNVPPEKHLSLKKNKQTFSETTVERLLAKLSKGYIFPNMKKTWRGQ